MIETHELQNRAVGPADLTDRQQQAYQLVRSYLSVARELPSSGWLARQLGISRRRALDHIEALRRKRWL